MKKVKIYMVCILFLMLMVINSSRSATTFYDLNTIQTIEITFSQSDWDYQMDTAKIGNDSYIMAQTVSINGTILDSVGVKYKGNSSYDSTYIKNPLHISLDEFKSQSYEGIKDIKLANMYADPSMIREVTAYNILKNYMDCPRANFIKVYINGNYIGLYSNTETVNKTFCSNHFYSSKNTLLDCTPTIIPGPSTKSNLKYIEGGDSTSYMDYYDVKSTYGWNDLKNLCDTITNYPSGLSNIMDVDRVLWMLAFDNALLNLDSYIGVFCQNYYLYRDGTGHYNPIVWDLNMSFGGFPYAGTTNKGMGNLTIAEMESLSTVNHSTDIYWPLINDVMANAEYKRMFYAHLKTITNEYLANNDYLTLVNQLNTLVSDAVQSDSNKFFTNTDYQNSLSTNIVFGSYAIPGITGLVNARNTYLQSTKEFKATAPTISSIASSKSSPVLKSEFSITAQATNSNNMYLGIRFDTLKKFTQVQMLDDGLHNDGTAGDGVYGATITMDSVEGQYYIYAENDSAGIFSPVRAEHEFYNLKAAVPTATVGQVVINEFVAKNTAGTTDENGKYEDWIELYNTTSDSLNLYGLYLTDDYTNPTKFAFPENTIIHAKGYMVIIADEDSTTATYIHCNFKLSADGEQIMLSDNLGSVLDSITFGAQTADVSMGRCPDGTGNFIYLTKPTFDSANACTNAIEELPTQTAFKVYPNPASDKIYLSLPNLNNETTLKICNALGMIIIDKQIDNSILNNNCEININNLENGIYFIQLNSGTISYTERFVIIH